MNKPNVTKFFNSIKQKSIKHSPAILTGLGVAGMITTVVLTARATTKAMALIEEEKQKKNNEKTDQGLDTNSDISLSPVEVVKTAWKPFIPVAISGAASVACIIGAHSVHARRHAALMTAYQISTTALSDYREKVVETIGEEKEATVRDKVSKKKIEEKPVESSAVIMTGRGNTLIYDSPSDRYFRSDIDKIRNAVLELNERMINGNEMYVSLNDFYDEIGLKHTQEGYRIGWRIDKGKIEISYSAQLTEDNEPCIVLDYLTPPEYEFDSLY